MRSASFPDGELPSAGSPTVSLSRVSPSSTAFCPDVVERDDNSR